MTAANGVYAFQAKMSAEVSASLVAGRRTMLQLPTAGGKTAIALSIARLYLAAGLRVWFLCHRRELVAQACARCEAEGVAYGVIQAGKRGDAAAAMQIGSVDTLAHRWESFEAPDLIVWDEAHRMASASWMKLAKRFPLARHLGLSATPERLDGKPLGEFFAGLVCGPQPAELQAAGALAQARVFAPSRPDLEGVKIVAGDYERDGLAERMADRTLIGDAVAHYRRLCDGRPALAFAVSIAHSRRVAARFRAEGIAAEHVDYQTGAAARADALRRLASGELKVLSSVELFTEGLDIGDVGAVILMRPTRSLRLYLQMVGRGRRVSAAWPDLVVLDHAGLAWDHGHPNADREWSLTQRRERSRAGAPPLWRCPDCSAVHAPAAQCPECGHAYRVARDGQPEAGGELVEWGERTEGLETVAAFAKRMGVREATLYTWVQKGMPRVGRLIPVTAASEWRDLWLSGSFERYSEAARKRQASLTPEQRRSAARKAVAGLTPDKLRKRSQKTAATFTPEKRRDAARKRLLTLGDRMGEIVRKGHAAKTPEQRSEAQHKRQANRTPEQRSRSARMSAASRTPEQRSEAARKGNEALTFEQRSERGRRANAALTPEQRKERTRKANAAMTQEQRSERARKGRATRKAKAAQPPVSPQAPK